MKLAHTVILLSPFWWYFSIFCSLGGWEVAGFFSCLETSLNLDSVLSKEVSLREMK